MSTQSHGLTGYLHDNQIEQLLRPINGTRVSKDGKGFSHVEAYEIRAHLNRIFGIARWSEEVLAQELVFETSTGTEKPKWTVCYRSLVRLTVFDPHGGQLATYTEGATGDATNMPSRADAHDMALKTSQSQAFKRAAVNLGDQFGLSLYNKGSLRPLVMRTLVGMPTAQAETETEESVDAHIDTPLAPESGDAETPQRETSSQPVVQPPADPGSTPGNGSGEGAPAQPSPAADQPVDLEAARDERDLANAEKAVRAVIPTATTDPDGQDPWAWALTEINAAVKLTPGDALQRLNRCTEHAVKHGLRERRIPNSEETLGAALMRLTRHAAAAAKKAG